MHSISRASYSLIMLPALQNIREVPAAQAEHMLVSLLQVSVIIELTVSSSLHSSSARFSADTQGPYK